MYYGKAMIDTGREFIALDSVEADNAEACMTELIARVEAGRYETDNAPVLVEDIATCLMINNVGCIESIKLSGLMVSR